MAGAGRAEPLPAPGRAGAGASLRRPPSERGGGWCGNPSPVCRSAVAEKFPPQTRPPPREARAGAGGSAAWGGGAGRGRPLPQASALLSAGAGVQGGEAVAWRAMAETVPQRRQTELKYGNAKAGPVAVVPRQVEARSVPVQPVHPRLVTAAEPRQETAYSQREKEANGNSKANFPTLQNLPKPPGAAAISQGLQGKRKNLGCAALLAAGV